MQPQICYALTNGEGDRYAAMTFISASLVRRVYPQAKIVVLVDELTEPLLVRQSAPIVKLADQIIRVQTGIDAPLARNRFVKTSVRLFVKGDYVYLDADALPIRRFGALFAGGADMAGVLNRN